MILSVLELKLYDVQIEEDTKIMQIVFYTVQYRQTLIIKQQLTWAKHRAFLPLSLLQILPSSVPAIHPWVQYPVLGDSMAGLEIVNGLQIL